VVSDIVADGLTIADTDDSGIRDVVALDTATPGEVSGFASRGGR
jgi:hypothetical protein